MEQQRIATYRALPRSFPAPRRLYVPRTVGNAQAITERKYFDSEVNALTMATITTLFTGAEADPATTNTLFAPTTGDDITNRQGRKVQVLSLKIRGEVKYAAQVDQLALDNAPLIRLALVQDTQTNGTQLNSEDVFQGAVNSGQGYLSFQNPANFGRFKVLKDKFMTLSTPTAVNDGTNVEVAGYSRYFKWSYKFTKPVVMHFNATNGGTVADIVDNSFHVLAGQTTSGIATLSYKCRVTFLDQ